MDNAKIEKINSEIERTKAKIAEMQTRLKTLERQKTDIEDAQIVALVRSEKISDAELNALMQSLRSHAKASTAPASVTVSEPKTKKQEETRNANEQDS